MDLSILDHNNSLPQKTYQVEVLCLSIHMTNDLNLTCILDCTRPHTQHCCFCLDALSFDWTNSCPDEMVANFKISRDVRYDVLLNFKKNLDIVVHLGAILKPE